ncbi:MAG: hypothetical protein HY313_11035 [Acidobacteria bacterium]|nr:hypothetical protein [Acidobacteriota bacterium]
MRKLNNLCHALEISGLGAVRETWKGYCGPDFALIEPCLRPTDDVGGIYPCPRQEVGNCPRRIVDYFDGEYGALCQHPGKFCEDLVLTRPAVLIYDLDIAAFTKMIAKPLGLRWQAPQKRGDQTWSIGVSGRRPSRNQPAFFICLLEGTRFERVFQKLLLDIAGPFLIITPTTRHRTAELQQYLQSRGIGFVSLEDDLLVDADGHLVPAEPIDSSEVVRPTPVAARKQAVSAFIARHRCKVRDIYDAAAVDESDFYKWRRGDLPDTSNKCRDIERILIQGLPRRSSPEPAPPSFRPVRPY